MAKKEMKHTLTGSAMFYGFEIHRRNWAKKREANTEKFFPKIYETNAYQNYLEWNNGRINKRFEQAQNQFEKAADSVEI